MEERLQKFLAEAGIASRRKSEELIAAGRVQVNGQVVRELGVKIDPAKDKVLFDNKPVSYTHLDVYKRQLSYHTALQENSFFSKPCGKMYVLEKWG